MHVASASSGAVAPRPSAPLPDGLDATIAFAASRLTAMGHQLHPWTVNEGRTAALTRCKGCRDAVTVTFNPATGAERILTDALETACSKAGR